MPSLSRSVRSPGWRKRVPAALNTKGANSKFESALSSRSTLRSISWAISQSNLIALWMFGPEAARA
jgi:hypothetical protein